MSGLALPMPARPAPLPAQLAKQAGPSRPSSSSGPAPTPAPPSAMASIAAVPRESTPLVKVQRQSASPSDDEQEVESDEEGEAKKKAGAGAAAKKKKTGQDGGYKYTSEISQMMFVFGEVQDPLPETVKMVEDIVRGQIIEIVTRARLLTHLRSSRYLSAEDLIFLIRADRGKVNRLRTYLSWKDVRKRAKEEDERGGDVEDDMDDGADKAAAKGRKTMVKLPWEVLTPFSDFLRSMPNRPDDDDEEDEDEAQAYQDSMQRLRDADEITKKMTKDEYVHYSDCRQASFTYRKARRFREFINFAAYLDVRPNDDIIDILGFLSFEMVRSLCVTALAVRDRLERSYHPPPQTQHASNHLQRKKSISTKNAVTSGPAASPVKRKSTMDVIGSPSKRPRSDIAQSPDNIVSSTKQKDSRERGAAPMSLFAPPPSAKQPLSPAHVLEAFSQIQRQQAASRVGGSRNFRGGIGRARVALV